MNNDYMNIHFVAGQWSKWQLGQFCILDVALRIRLLLVFSFFHEIVKLPTDKE